MGLDVSHDAWHGAYSAFMRFRLALCEAAGYELVESIDRPGTRMPELWNINFPMDRYQGDGWEQNPPEDPLVVLLVHSDCDGRIPHSWTLPLAQRLEELAPKMPAEGGGHFYDPRGQTLQFAQGCRQAHEAGEDLEFW